MESQRANLPILNKLLTSGVENESDEPTQFDIYVDEAVDAAHSIETELQQDARLHKRAERRKNRKERRLGLPDTRANRIDRRFNVAERRKVSKAEEAKAPEELDVEEASDGQPREAYAA